MVKTYSIKLGDETLATASQVDLENVERNWYFPTSSLEHRDRFLDSDTHTTCGWKGVASYYHYKKPSGEVLKDVAWYYPTPKAGAEAVKDRVAFYVGKGGIKVVEH